MSLEPRKQALSEVTTLRIGGWTDRFFEVSDTGELKEYVARVDDPASAIVLGRGSNTLFPDGKFERPVVKLTGEFEKYTFGEENVRAGSAVFFPELALEAAQQGFAGLEWAAGVPGSVGGAVAMNAGAYGSRTQEVLREVDLVDFDGKQRSVEADEVEFAYRYCELREQGFVVEVEFDLTSGEAPEVVDRTKNLLRERREEQPVGRHSAGCVFKNVNGHSAGRLIDEAGMKGARRGDVEVSEEHANYFINHGEGTYEDMVTLIDEVREAVRDEFDHDLETELRIVREN